jgi:hypothetical protein
MFASLEDMVRWVKREGNDQTGPGCERTGLSIGISSMSVYRMHRINIANSNKT